MRNEQWKKRKNIKGLLHVREKRQWYRLKKEKEGYKKVSSYERVAGCVKAKEQVKTFRKWNKRIVSD